MSPSIKDQFEKIKLTYQHKTPAKDRPDISNPQEAYHQLMRSWDQGEIDLIEEVKLLLLDRSSRLMSIYSLCRGGMDKDNLTLDPKVIYAAALIRKAHQIVLAQNYPGGVFDPSYLDNGQINQLSEGGFILDIPLIDYMVVTPDGYYSHLKDARKGFTQIPPSPQ
ncbi:hypothetical protein BFP97_06390 [Roseivirga sp. 4D4]|uniref:JAB domain-containing protein n=1 Tax=Roseivirga sp. 4D4 TaxID=1889784 RepID=UPI000852DFC7|nr:JAB domain-containing protein [Roseivirga sp. 4D4]OEK01160.1 hypothetical protein BFP97_06390 [Roseivirga sp. 4D4]